jgi:hypothetical protein
MLLAMAIRISRSNQKWGSHTEFTVAQAGIKGVARRSLSAWRGKPADPPRTAIRSSGSTGPHLRSINLKEVRNENLIRRPRCSGASDRRKHRTGNRAGAETAGWRHLARHLSACRQRLAKCRHNNSALRVPIRLRPSCKVARPLGLGPVIHNQSKNFSGPAGDRTEVADPPNPLSVTGRNHSGKA